MARVKSSLVTNASFDKGDFNMKLRVYKGTQQVGNPMFCELLSFCNFRFFFMKKMFVIISEL